MRKGYVYHTKEFGFNPKEEETVEGLIQRVEMTGFMWYKNISGPSGEK